MNLLKISIAAASVLVAGSSFAQFGAATKSAFGADGQGSYASFSPFTSVRAGGSTSSGSLLSFEKLNADGKSRIGAWYGSIDGGTGFGAHFRKEMADFDLQLGLITGDFAGDDLDLTLLAFKSLNNTGGGDRGFDAELFGGIYRRGANSKTDLTFGTRVSKALQNGWSLDGTFWYVTGSPNNTWLSVGVGYRF